MLMMYQSVDKNTPQNNIKYLCIGKHMEKKVFRRIYGRILRVLEKCYLFFDISENNIYQFYEL